MTICLSSILHNYFLYLFIFLWARPWSPFLHSSHWWTMPVLYWMSCLPSLFYFYFVSIVSLDWLSSLSSVAIKLHTLFIYSLTCCLHPMISWSSVTKSRTRTDQDRPLARLRLHDWNVVFSLYTLGIIPRIWRYEPRSTCQVQKGHGIIPTDEAKLHPGALWRKRSCPLPQSTETSWSPQGCFIFNGQGY